MTSNPLTVMAYACATTVLLAMNLEPENISNLAGFTILCAPPKKPSYYLANRIHFIESNNLNNQWIPSNIAPFQ